MFGVQFLASSPFLKPAFLYGPVFAFLCNWQSLCSEDYTRAMLYTIVTKEPVAAQLITLHNLWFMLSLGAAIC